MYVFFLSGPTASNSLIIVNVTVSTVTLSWMPPDSPNGIITQYQLQYRMVGGTYTTLQLPNTDLTRTVTGLTSGTEYEFRVRARTSVGYGSFSNVVNVITGKLHMYMYLHEYKVHTITSFWFLLFTSCN